MYHRPDFFCFLLFFEIMSLVLTLDKLLTQYTSFLLLQILQVFFYYLSLDFFKFIYLGSDLLQVSVTSWLIEIVPGKVTRENRQNTTWFKWIIGVYRAYYDEIFLSRPWNFYFERKVSKCFRKRNVCCEILFSLFTQSSFIHAIMIMFPS